MKGQLSCLKFVANFSVRFLHKKTSYKLVFSLRNVSQIVYLIKIMYLIQVAYLVHIMSVTQIMYLVPIMYLTQVTYVI
jgi:hypothetical protein